jgi:hypothetical protein
MSNPLSIVWAPSSTTALAAQQFVVEGGSFAFVNPVPTQNIFTGQLTIGTNLPPYTCRVLYFENYSIADSVTFLVTGSNPFGEFLEESVTIGANSTEFSTFPYSVIFSCIMTSADQVSASLGFTNDGFISPIALDSWNKSSAYTISFTDVTGDSDSIEFTPIFTNLPLNVFENGQIIQTVIDDTNSFNLPLTNDNVIISASFDIPSYPIDLAPSNYVSFSMVGIPLTALSAQISGGTAGMTITILQQGGKF